MASQDSASTLAGDEAVAAHVSVKLNLAKLPPVFILPTHLGAVELDDAEEHLRAGGAPLTYDPLEARVFLTKVMQKRRALLELRSRGVVTEEVSITEVTTAKSEDERPVKKRRIDVSALSARKRQAPPRNESSTESEPDNASTLQQSPAKHSSPGLEASESDRQPQFRLLEDESILCVLKLDWLQDLVKQEGVLAIEDYAIYLGRRNSKSTPAAAKPAISTSQHETEQSSPPPLKTTVAIPPKATVGQDILERALAEAPPSHSDPHSFASSSQISGRIHARSNGRVAHLIHQTTSEHDLGRSTELPEMPDWVQRHSNYSCERVTPLVGPNDRFVEELKKIRLARTLTNDEIGVRAYSTSIAAIAAYPYTLTDQREILALPGCDHKIAALWVEWKNKNGFVQAAYDAENDEQMKILHFFWEIWGVGSHTAQDFYAKGWRDLDDIVEFGWNELSRVQQIGVKYYDEFLLKLSRSEVEFIGAKVHEHAQRVREPTGVRTCIVGGHRRGKKASGDVDIIVSHLDEEATIGIVEDIVKSLYDEGWVTHELITHTSASRRSQATLPYRSGGGGHGFDTLDKALVVWQDPDFPGKPSPKDSAEEGDAKRKKNPNVHRRVDIIIAPWSKVGCAVLGWTAGTTFERDLRRYARKVKGWKFDSSGVRDRNTGEEVDLESVGGRCTTIDEAERKVFKGFGLEWREPWERNTG